jgi:hypothetical protein
MSASVDRLARLRNFILSNTFRFIESKELSALLGKDAWQQELQLLINYEGYNIVVAPALAEHGPHFILLKSSQQSLWFSDEIPIRARQAISKRGELSCKLCGRTQGDADPTTTGRRLRLFVSRFVEPQVWSGKASKNIDIMCTACREGLVGLQLDRPSARKLKIQVRRANGIDQLDLLNWLVKKYPDQARKYLKSRRPQAQTR